MAFQVRAPMPFNYRVRIDQLFHCKDISLVDRPSMEY
jgi:hypothetical protein